VFGRLNILGLWTFEIAEADNNAGNRIALPFATISEHLASLTGVNLGSSNMVKD